MSQLPYHKQKLRVLKLNENNLTTIVDGTFSHLLNLVELDLNNNKLSSIKPGLFSQLTQLQQLYLLGNDLHCDCYNMTFMLAMNLQAISLSCISSTSDGISPPYITSPGISDEWSQWELWPLVATPRAPPEYNCLSSMVIMKRRCAPCSKYHHPYCVLHPQPLDQNQG
jgi:hypothetical protein